jgi:hypothetical protein
VLFRLVAFYKLRFHDAELKRASVLWLLFSLPVVVAKYATRLMGLSISQWVAITLGTMFATGMLFVFLLAIDIYEEQFRGSKIAFAGILAAACLCGPAILWQLSHRWFGVALPPETALLVLGVMFAVGALLCPALLLVASFRSTRE